MRILLTALNLPLISWGDKWVQGACSDRTLGFTGALLQWRALAQTLWIYSNISPLNPVKLTSAF